MTEEKKPNTGEQGRITQPVAPIAGKEHSRQHLNQAYQNFKRWLRIFLKDFCLRLYRARFVIEVLGLIGLLYYAYQARVGNSLTREIVRSTIAPAPACVAQGSFSRHGSSEAPLVGAFYVNCGNAGKLSAKHVKGMVIITAESFPDERMLHTESWPFGSDDAEITPSEGGVWAFYSSAFEPEKEIPLIVAGQEIVIGEVKFSYTDESGETIKKESCRVEMNNIEIGGSPDSWVDCRMLTAIKDLRRAQKRRSQNKQ